MKIPFEITPIQTTDEIGKYLAEWILPRIIQHITYLRAGLWEIEVKKPTRTSKQNKSLHLFCAWLADALNEADKRLVLKYFGKEFEIDWTPDMVKERIWRPIQRVLTKKESSTKLTTTEVSTIAGTIRDNLAKTLSIILNFPNELDRQLGVSNYEVIK